MGIRRILGLLSAVALVLAISAPSGAAVSPLSLASGPSPFAAGCNGAPQSGDVFRNVEVEPWIDVNPTDSRNLLAVYQQDRFSSGGANGNLTSVSFNGGITWKRPELGAQPRFGRCQGGTEANGGPFERVTDPWVSFGPDGDAFQIALSFNDSNFDHAVLVSRSTDGGETWGPNATLLRENDGNVFRDKESITADYTDANNVYAVWDRLAFPIERVGDVEALRALAFRGPAMFTRTTDDGATWERPRMIYDPGQNNQTIGNQIVVMPDGDLVNVFNEINSFKNALTLGGFTLTVLRSTDQGQTWSDPIRINRPLNAGVTDPRDGAPVRTGDILPEVASDERVGTDHVYVVWQDARFTGGERDQIAFSRSTDGGLTWSRPARVSANLDTQAFTPSIDVDDAGNIAVTYYDFSADTTASPTLDTQYWVTRSTDGGQTWSAREEVTDGPFDMRTAPDARGFFTGDYQGLESAGTIFKPLVVVANSGNTANRTDAFSATFGPPFP